MLNSPSNFHAEFLSAFNARDSARLLKLYEPGAKLVMGPGQEPTGHAAIEKTFAEFLAMNPKMQMETLYVVESGDMALTSSKWSLTGTGPDGNPMALQGKAVEVLRRQSDGSWLAVIDSPFGAN